MCRALVLRRYGGGGVWLWSWAISTYTLMAASFLEKNKGLSKGNPVSGFPHKCVTLNS